MKGEESEIQKRMSYEMSLVWLLSSSSAQWSLPPGESAVWIKPLMAGANGAAADRAHPTSASCHLSTGGGRWGDGRAGVREKEKEQKREERYQENRFSRFKLITPTWAVSTNRRRRTRRRKGKIKESKRSSGKEEIQEGRWEWEGGITRKKITLGDGSIVLESITPTQAFSNEQEEELNDWIRGGEAIKWKEEKRGWGGKIVVVFSSVFLAAVDTSSLYVCWWYHEYKKQTEDSTQNTVMC